MVPMKNFHHPFQPYPIQQVFMAAVAECIDHGKIGIFESPTGTGKSLSLICASMTWLREHKRREFEASLELGQDDDEPDWVLEHAKNEKRRQVAEKKEELERKLNAIREREANARKRQANKEPNFKKRKVDDERDATDDDGDKYLLDDYESDTDPRKVRSHSLADLGLSKETEALFRKLGMMPKNHSTTDDEEADELKIIFCSRTHSQLSQFSSELRRVKLPPVLPNYNTESKIDQEVDQLNEAVKHLTLGSRRNLCINPKVNKLSSATAINEKCLELQESRTSPNCKCSFRITPEKSVEVTDFRNHALAEIRDIEDLAAVGRKLSICPYYASRTAIKPSEIVSLPYPLLLQKSAREALGLSLRNNIVIIDEAHNLIDTIINTYSATVSFSELQRGREQLLIYLRKFSKRLKGKNRVYITQLVRLMDSLISYLQARSESNKSDKDSVRLGELLAGKAVDQINLYKLMRYLDESKLARKVDGYVAFSESVQNPGAKTVESPTLFQFQQFMLALTKPEKEGRFFYKCESGQDAMLKYMLLDPSHHFKEIVDEARSVILAGGTMAPMDEIVDQLFPYLSQDKIMTLSCGHVVPSSSLLAYPVAFDHHGKTFEFTFKEREKMISPLGSTLLQLLPQIPSGVVVFFPSYAYLHSCVRTWQSNGTWGRLSSLKPIFFESQPSSNITNKSASSSSRRTHAAITQPTTLQSYTTAILSSPERGATLLAVTNGSLSEGINFSDALGRAVIVVGIPHADVTSPELLARRAYVVERAEAAAARAPTSTMTKHASSNAITPSTVSATATASSDKTPLLPASAVEAGRRAASAFWGNAAMRKVNQAVGRAIRHKGDYAAVLLLDGRYREGFYRERLPGWIAQSLKGEKGVPVGEIVGELGKFFEGMEQAGSKV